MGSAQYLRYCWFFSFDPFFRCDVREFYFNDVKKFMEFVLYEEVSFSKFLKESTVSMSWLQCLFLIFSFEWWIKEICVLGTVVWDAKGAFGKWATKLLVALTLNPVESHVKQTFMMRLIMDMGIFLRNFAKSKIRSN